MSITNIETFIFIHNQDIILDFIKNEKFKNIENLKYVFLGKGDVDKVRNLDNIIICRELEHNIEEYPNLTSFSGWYALWKNNLCSGEYLNLFEYDIKLSDNFIEKIESLDNKTNVIGYIPFNVHHVNFIKIDMWILPLIKAIKRIYNNDVYDFINSLSKDKLCSMTSNHTLKKEIFDDYMKWIEPMIDDIKNDGLSGHMCERSISLFYLLNNIENVVIIDGILSHYQFNSHGNQSISQDYFKNNYIKLINND